MWRLLETKDFSQWERSEEGVAVEGWEPVEETSAPLGYVRRIYITRYVVESEGCNRWGSAWLEIGDVRGEEASGACEDGDIDVVAGGDFVHFGRKREILVLIHGIELLGLVERYNGQFAAVFERHCVVGHFD
jgi:hypothetical protein